jgi:hypothetical protein
MLLFVRSKSTAVAAAALIALSWGTAAGLASADPPAPPSPGPAPGPPSEPPQPGAKTAIDHDGTFAVGTDIVPGTYTSAGPVGNGTCYWKRIGTGDDGKQLVDNAMSKKPQVVRIDPTDKAFKTDGCQPWQKNDAAVPDPGKTPAEAGLPLGILGSLLGGGGPPPSPAPPPPPKP